MDKQAHTLSNTVKENQDTKCEMSNKSQILDDTLKHNYDTVEDLSAFKTTVTGNLKLVKQQNTSWNELSSTRLRQLDCKNTLSYIFVCKLV